MLPYLCSPVCKIFPPLARLEETARAASLYRAVQTYVGETGGNKDRDRLVGEGLNSSKMGPTNKQTIIRLT